MMIIVNFVWSYVNYSFAGLILLVVSHRVDIYW